MVESTLAFQEGTIDAQEVKTLFDKGATEAARYNLDISRVSGEPTSPAVGQHHAARAPLSPASGFLHFPLMLVGGGSLLWETALTTAFPFSE